MIVDRPKFLDSPFFYVKPAGGWALKPGAPKAVREEFENFQKKVKKAGYLKL